MRGYDDNALSPPFLLVSMVVGFRGVVVEVVGKEGKGMLEVSSCGPLRPQWRHYRCIGGDDGE